MENGKKKRKKPKRTLTAEQLIAGMRGNRNLMPTLGGEYVVKRKRR